MLLDQELRVQLQQASVLCKDYMKSKQTMWTNICIGHCTASMTAGGPFLLLSVKAGVRTNEKRFDVPPALR